ncbi:MAG: dephospho-CoA kinase [Clostridia bacterium]|nr:dephospho-CoA kinase [Clostridia bacterium]
MTANKRVFGITGGSGSGKSYVSDIFRKNGVTVFDGDVLAHEVAMPDGEAYAELFEHFGGEYFAENGLLDRKKLAAKVFSDKSELGILNGIMHKHIKGRIERGLENVSLAAIDGAVIIGSPVEEMCEFLVGVTAPYDKRLERIIKRDGIGEAAARARLDAQPNEQFYRQNCRYIIENDGEKSVEAEVLKILEEFK